MHSTRLPKRIRRRQEWRRCMHASLWAPSKDTWLRCKRRYLIFNLIGVSWRSQILVMLRRCEQTGARFWVIHGHPGKSSSRRLLRIALKPFYVFSSSDQRDVPQESTPPQRTCRFPNRFKHLADQDQIYHLLQHLEVFRPMQPVKKCFPQELSQTLPHSLKPHQPLRQRHPLQKMRMTRLFR